MLRRIKVSTLKRLKRTIREIEDYSVVNTVSFVAVLGSRLSDYRVNLRCHAAFSHGGCTDGGCAVNQVGPIRMSNKRPTHLD